MNQSGVIGGLSVRFNENSEVVYSVGEPPCICVQAFCNEELGRLLVRKQKLEFHVDRTQMWLSHLGCWKAHVLHSDVSRLRVFFSVLCDQQFSFAFKLAHASCVKCSLLFTKRTYDEKLLECL